LHYKAIDRSKDLAINGAPPAFSEPLHVGRPNVGDRAVFDGYVAEMFERNWLTNDGPLVHEFERRVAEYAHVKHCIAMNNGTIALEIAIRALGMTGEVIVPSYTFIATAHALHWQGVTPVFADIDPVTHTLDPAAVRRMITPRTTGIIGVHLWGRPAQVRELTEIAEEFGLELMFDAAHAFGSSLGGVQVGGFGRAEVFSFHATKFLNAFEGGAVVTNDDDLAAKIRLMRNFGFAGADRVIHPGTNGKMVEVCAAMGLTNLASIDDVIDVNRSNYHAYRDGLAGIAGVRLLEFDESEANNFQYIVVEVDTDAPAGRDDVVGALVAENVLARKYFWPGCHRMEPYRDLYPHAGLMLPQTTSVADCVVVLPTGNGVTAEMISVITGVIRLVVEGARS